MIMIMIMNIYDMIIIYNPFKSAFILPNLMMMGKFDGDHDYTDNSIHDQHQTSPSSPSLAI